MNRLLIVSERLGEVPAPPEAHRHISTFDHDQAEPEDEEPVLEPVEYPAG